MTDHRRQKRPRTSVKMSDKTLREISKKNLSEVPPPASGWQARKEAWHAAKAKLRAQVEAQQEATDEETKTIELTATVERSPPSALPETNPKRSEHGTRALADLEARKASKRTISADQVTEVAQMGPEIRIGTDGKSYPIRKRPTGANAHAGRRRAGLPGMGHVSAVRDRMGRNQSRSRGAGRHRHGREAAD
jgi:hypothetical protein